MTDEMLVAQAQWLPQYAGEIMAAKERLDQAGINGTRVKLVETRGAVRLHVKSVEEMASDRAASAALADAADKGKMTKSA